MRKFTLFGLGLWMAVGLSLTPSISWGVSLCQTQTNVPGLPQVSCKFPQCPNGADCTAPTIQTQQSRVEFYEPLLRWRENCPELEAPCWEVYLDVRFDVAAQDGAGISKVGVVLYEELRGNRKTHELWANATGTGTVHSAQRSIRLYAPANSKLELGVLEACAKDGEGNEQCRIPSGRSTLNLGN